MASEYFFDNLIEKIYKQLISREDLNKLKQRAVNSAMVMAVNRYGEIMRRKVREMATSGGGDLGALLSHTGYDRSIFNYLVNSREWREAYYEEAYAILNGDRNGKTPAYWQDLFSEIVEGNLVLSELFIRTIEEQEGVKIADVEQLQKITGIREVAGAWNKDQGVTVPYKDHEITDPKQEAIRQLTDLLNEARLYRYLSAVETKIRDGAFYEELKPITLASFGLPETFTVCGREYNQERALGHAVALAMDLLTREDSADLKALAMALQAPYTVLLEANNIRNEILKEAETTE